MVNGKWENICSRADTCALTGAAAFFAGIPKSEVLVNGPLWCYFYALRHLEHIEYNMAERFHGSQPDNNAIVYGTEKFLLEALESVKKEKQNPDVMLIENSCSLSLIGDDIAGIAKKADLKCPVITMDSGGLNGGFAEGYSKAAIKLLESLQLEKSKNPSLKVNLIGLTPFYFNGKNDAEEIIRLLKLSCSDINVILGCGSPYDKIKTLTDASLNIVIHEELGLGIARYLKENYDMPYICAGVPYGTDGTQEWISKIAECLPLSDEQVLYEAKEVQKKLMYWNNDMRCQWGNLWFDEVITAAPPTTAMCFADTLVREWIDTGSLNLICQHKTDNNCGAGKYANKIFFAGEDGENIEYLLNNFSDGLLTGSSSEKAVLDRSGNYNTATVNIAFPVNDEMLITDLPFCGLRGSAHILQRLWNAFIQKKQRR